MVTAVLPQRDELGLADGQMLAVGDWLPAADGRTWVHRRLATGITVGQFPIAWPADRDAAAFRAGSALARPSPAAR